MRIRLSPEIESAIMARRPVVALESTVISHGLPFPENLNTARRMESIIRDAGAAPATIAVIDGEFCAGLEAPQLERLADGRSIRKISRRDLAIAVARKLTCATTVASTAFIARNAGIEVFATGGIGGVHRGYGADVSADLVELARTPMTVVCSGAKIVLDLPATREWLETYGITVIGWQCDEMPAFYSRSSGLAIDARVDTAADAAEIISSRNELGLTGAVLITVPVPVEFEIERTEIEALIVEALAAADAALISGKEITPFLLAELSRQSSGRTLAANIALLENNARIAAEIAGELTRLDPH